MFRVESFDTHLYDLQPEGWRNGVKPTEWLEFLPSAALGRLGGSSILGPQTMLALEGATGELPVAVWPVRGMIYVVVGRVCAESPVTL
jgi:hypothetical protein